MDKKRHTRHINTKKFQKIKYIERLLKLVPFTYLVWGATTFDFVAIFRESILGGVYAVLNIILVTIFTFIPYSIILREVMGVIKGSIMKNTSFPVIQNIDYFRDELSGISPATISMCMDLEVEIEKDVVAQILKYSMDGILDIDAEEIVVKKLEFPEMKKSDSYLLQKLQQGSVDIASLSEWRKLVEIEVSQGEFIEKNDRKVKSKKIGCLPGIVFFIITMIATLVLPLNSLEEASEMSFVEMAEFFAEYPKAGMFILIYMVLAFIMIGLLVRPIALLIAEKINRGIQSPYKRTAKGEILTEEIYGMKNFIRDFSMLKEAEKEMLVLWDDFLIYAVLLEENQLIVNDIAKMRNVNLRNIREWRKC